MILLLKVCGDGQEGSYECYRQDWYFNASLVAGNFKISEIYNANKQFSRVKSKVDGLGSKWTVRGFKLDGPND